MTGHFIICFCSSSSSTYLSLSTLVLCTPSLRWPQKTRNLPNKSTVKNNQASLIESLFAVTFCREGIYSTIPDLAFVFMFPKSWRKWVILITINGLAATNYIFSWSLLLTPRDCKRVQLKIEHSKSKAWYFFTSVSPLWRYFDHMIKPRGKAIWARATWSKLCENQFINHALYLIHKWRQKPAIWLVWACFFPPW